MNWNVIYTKSRSEKTVADKLRSAGMEVFCPLLKSRKIWSDRWKWVEEPLFRSYCFVRTEEKDRENVLQTPGVVRYVFHCGKPAVVRNIEMEALMKWMGIYEHDSLTAGNFNLNDRIKFSSGALADKEGAIIETRGNFATLYLENMGFQVRVDLRKNLVEKV